MRLRTTLPQAGAGHRPPPFMNQLSSTIAISGASGLVGRTLTQRMASRGAQIRPLVRGSVPSERDIPWQPGQPVSPEHWEGVDALVHLAGENIASGRWTSARKERLWRSRVEATQALCEGIAATAQRPKVLVCASAIGWYGDRGDETLLETSNPGAGFLAELSQAWEQACAPAVSVGVRVVHARFGIILSKEGGALAKMLTPFRLGLGGRVGSGHQYWSWISLTDAVRAIEFALERDEVRGPVNVVGPVPSTNREFTRALGKALGRTTIAPLPAFAAKLALGKEMAEGLLLASARVEPRVLVENGFTFEHPDLATAFDHVLD